MQMDIMAVAVEMMLLTEMLVVAVAVGATAVAVAVALATPVVVVAVEVVEDMYEPLQITQLYGHIAHPPAAREIITQQA